MGAGPSSATVGLQSGPLHGTLVLYSLGNALFDQGGLADTRRSALVVATLDEEGVESVRVVPFVLDPVESRVVAPDLETAKIIREQLNLPEAQGLLPSRADRGAVGRQGSCTICPWLWSFR